MKQKAFLNLLPFMFAGIVNASASYGNQDLEDQIFCPQEIACTSWSDGQTCKPTIDINNYWDDTVGSPEATYSFNHADTIQHSGSTRTKLVGCDYIYQSGPENPGEYEKITIHAARELNLEPSFEGTSLWEVTGDARTDCFTDTPSVCPLIETPNEAMIILNEDVYGLFIVYINDVKSSGETTKLLLNSNDYFVRTGCMNLQECPVKIIAKTIVNNLVVYSDAGIIYLEPQNSMKITRVIQDQNSPLKIYKHSTLNTVIISN